MNGSSGDDANDGSSWEHAKLTIGNATGTVDSNGIVQIADGQYTGTGNTNITINKNMNITGESQSGTIMNGTDNSWVFNIQPGVAVTIRNLTLTNGYTTGSGGAIYNQGTLTLENCSFTNNTANSQSSLEGGGAVYNYQSTLKVVNCSFTNDRTLGLYHYGGAIGSFLGTLDVTGCTFDGNVAEDRGGAISNFQGTSNISNSTFRGNYGSSDSAIYNIYGAMNITNCTFTNNGQKVGYYTPLGGVIENMYANLEVTSCTFLNNYAYFGGAIYNNVGASNIVEIHFNRFYGNTANYGTAIWNNAGTLNATNNWWGSNVNPMTISNLIYVYGGSVYADPWIILTITPTSELIGSGESSVVSVSLKYNSNGDDTSPLGAVPPVDVVFDVNSLGDLNPLNDIISDGLNTTTTFTAGLTPGFATVNATVDGQNLKTTIRIMDRDDIYVAATGDDTTGNGSPSYPFLTLNRAISEVRSNGRIHIANGEYKDPLDSGLSIDKDMTIFQDTWIPGSGTVVIINADGNGGIFIISPGVSVTLRNLTLTNGTGFGFGGAILNQGDLNILNCTFSNNYADYFGGAIYSDGNLTISNTVFTGNWVPDSYNTYSGGAICNMANMNITNSTFTKNSAGSGGAILSQNYMSNFLVTVNNSVFSENYASNYGGAFYIYDGNHTNNLIHFNRIVGNIAPEGNAIYIAYGSLNATLNWWGSNTDPSTINNLIVMDTGCDVLSDPWIILSVNATPNNINNGETSNITADFNHINGGSPLTGGYIPDGSIKLDVPWGSFNSSVISHSFTGNTIVGVLTATFYAIEGAVNPLFNPVRVNATADGYTTIDTEAAYINIIPAANLTISKTAPGTVIAGNQITYTITATNNGPDTATGVIISDTFPMGISNISWNVEYSGGASGPTSGTGNLNINLGTLPTGGSCIITVNGTVLSSIPADTILFNTVAITSSTYITDPDNTSDTVFTTVEQESAIELEKTVDNARPDVGDTITYTVTVHNNGPSDAINIQIQDIMPAGFKNVVITHSKGNYNSETGIWILHLDTGENATLNLTGEVTSLLAGKNTTNTATLIGTTNTTNATIYVPQADLYIQITSDKNNPRAGETFTLTYKLGNNGPDDAQNVTITIPIPEGFVISEIKGDGTWTQNGNTITWTFNNVIVGDPYLYIIGWTTGPGIYLFTASIASETFSINSMGVNSLSLNAVTPVNAGSVTSNTVGMQNTGIPLAGIVLAILMILGGFIGTRKKE
ncbi:hypothetical protein BK007_10410 [Methanobacterium subterraneum]|uniref:DUF11 domain-containing protein n=1 Tax=Methanobacterium subterraneum TaxID=59277 RepID=A0A2H4VE61_9EURY|nr:DUF11 domain-containing protein [Methanobacterium subterraneum]AUB56385.1 hypothetical protein BK007_10410 [Methanobacterium subterraneum]